jgi:hypothetical protein
MVTVLTAVIILLAIAAVAVWLVTTRAHHGTPKLAAAPPKPKLQQVLLCQSCAYGYNPLGSPTDEAPDAPLAIDGDINTPWKTQDYYTGQLNKAGVGIYVDAKPGTVAKEVVVYTKTPGFTAKVYGENGTPDTTAWNPGPGSWQLLGSVSSVGRKQQITLTNTTKYRYYLLWITNLGTGNQQIDINELALYAYKTS